MRRKIIKKEVIDKKLKKRRRKTEGWKAGNKERSVGRQTGNRGGRGRRDD